MQSKHPKYINGAFKLENGISDLIMDDKKNLRIVPVFVF
jgi:hypothetical protein